MIRARLTLAAVLLAAGLAAGAPAGGPSGCAYDRAVARMTVVNHLLERQQTSLFEARRRGAPARDLIGLRRTVAALERRYVRASLALVRAQRRECAAARVHRGASP